MTKIGRNQPCICGSGSKYKHCCGKLSQPMPPIGSHALMLRREEARRLQRERQQGLGKPIISTEADGYRWVAVGNRMLFSEDWRTFHDFLRDYLRDIMGKDWLQSESAKAPEAQHPLAKWISIAIAHARQAMPSSNGVSFGRMTCATAAILNLSNDLYALHHNVEVQARLVERLRDPNMFFGARFEIYVAAALIRANFDIEFEDEGDRRSTHCEYTAKYKPSGKKYSIEAKRRHGSKPGLGKFLVAALGKAAKHERVVFIDANLPDSGEDEGMPRSIESSARKLADFENKKINGNDLPSAYVFVVNYPWEHHLDAVEVRCVYYFDGFKIPGFSFRDSRATLRQIINARKTHAEMYALVEGMGKFSDIPVTFNGSIPELEFSPIKRERLLIGNEYLVPLPDSGTMRGVMTQGAVMENEGRAYCSYNLENGSSVIVGHDLSEDEMLAWRHHPETFFGVVEHKQHADHPIDLYDFLVENYKGTPREKLLEFLKGAPDYEALRALGDGDLLSQYAERCVLATLATTKSPGDAMS